MNDSHRCPRCGSPLTPSQAESGDCQACLLDLALNADSTESSESGDTGGVDPTQRGSERPALGPGDRIGPFSLIRVLGEGGMGVVYLAEQQEPLRRQVAIKVIKRGMDTRAVVRRFEAERQALARMDHPAIARVFEAGEADNGRPYFVMEYIEGEPISEYCDRHRLNTVARLALFQRVCEGLQHAHQRGIIHRDIKPSNILVADDGGKPLPKIIDFGVARAVERDLSDLSKMTALGVLLGTPEYMSPEQADLSPLDVDTRTDVYSLGVVLYELLTGALPFDAEQLRGAAFDELRRQIREVMPARPSARVSRLGPGADEVAGRRQTAPGTLSRSLSGDLDLITMKALEKERERRYRSPAELAADIGRHLENQPVLARPPSAGYQLRKLVSRHRVPSALAVLFLVTLVGFSIWMTVLYRRALTAEADAARKATLAKQVSDFVVGVFEVSDPGEARGNSATARELLDGAAERIDDDLAGQPEVQVAMLSTLSRVYSSLGLDQRALELGKEALVRLESKDAALEDRDELLADAVLTMATAHNLRAEYDEAETLALQGLALFEKEAGPHSLEVVGALEILLHVHWRRKEPEESLAVAERMVDILQKHWSHRPALLAGAANNLGNVNLFLGNHDAAEIAFKQAIDTRTAAGDENHPGVMTAIGNLAEAYRSQGRYEEAIPLLLQVQQHDIEVYGMEHFSTAYGFNNLGMVYKSLKRYDEAAEQFQTALKIREAALRPGHPMIAWTLDNLGLTNLKQKDLSAAERNIERALKIAKESVGEEHPDTAIVMANLSLVRIDQKRFAEAEELLKSTMQINLNSFGAEHRNVGNTYHNLGELYESWGRRQDAVDHFRLGLEILEATNGPDHPDTVDTRARLKAAEESGG